MCVGTGSIWKISILSAQFCCETKSTLKNKVSALKKKKDKDRKVQTISIYIDIFSFSWEKRHRATHTEINMK